jgi:hypothetical protein
MGKGGRSRAPDVGAGGGDGDSNTPGNQESLPERTRNLERGARLEGEEGSSLLSLAWEAEGHALPPAPQARRSLSPTPSALGTSARCGEPGPLDAWLEVLDDGEELKDELAGPGTGEDADYAEDATGASLVPR